MLRAWLRGAAPAGLGCGAWQGDAELERLWQLDREFEPGLSRDQAASLQAEWRRAVERSRDWARPERR